MNRRDFLFREKFSGITFTRIKADVPSHYGVFWEHVAIVRQPVVMDRYATHGGFRISGSRYLGVTTTPGPIKCTR